MNQREMESEIEMLMAKKFLSDYMGAVGELGNSKLMKAVEVQILGYDPSKEWETETGMTKAEAHRMDRAVTAVVKRLTKKDPHYEFNISRKDIPRYSTLMGRYR
jgi:hypothetical protein